MFVDWHSNQIDQPSNKMIHIHPHCHQVPKFALHSSQLQVHPLQGVFLIMENTHTEYCLHPSLTHNRSRRLCRAKPIFSAPSAPGPVPGCHFLSLFFHCPIPDVVSLTSSRFWSYRDWLHTGDIENVREGEKGRMWEKETAKDKTYALNFTFKP